MSLNGQNGNVTDELNTSYYEWLNGNKSVITEDLSKLVSESSEEIAELIKSLIEVANFTVAVRRSLSADAVPKIAGMAARLAEIGEQLTQELGGIETLEKSIDVIREAKTEAAQDTSKVGLFTLMRTMNDPDIQKGLKFMLALAKNMSKLAK